MGQRVTLRVELRVEQHAADRQLGGPLGARGRAAEERLPRPEGAPEPGVVRGVKPDHD
jgi:hypothetical protein